jgi:hypothetical protein
MTQIKGNSMARTFNILIFALTLMGVLLVGCQSDESSGPTSGEGQLSGFVYDQSTNGPLSGAVILATSVGEGNKVDSSKADGSFAIKFTVDSTTTISVRVTKTGYTDYTTALTLRSGSVTTLNVVLTPKSIVVPPGGSSGQAQTIAFLGATPENISVYGVGATETSILQWEVRDSLGLAIDASHAVDLTFTVNGPGGGEYISPARLSTNAQGRGTTTLNAGTRSGVIQIVAQATVGPRTIRSSPVQVVINGGFPVQDHFSIAAPQFNFPALGTMGRSLAVSVLVGDIYSNPVVKGTAVYFRSSAGVVQPSVFTSADGQGSVALFSGNPEPYGSYASVTYGSGYHYVVARTLGQSGTPVQDSILVLWSGDGRITGVTPTSFDIANAGSQSFSFRVADQLGHPLARGTTITFLATIPPPPNPNLQQNQVSVSFGNNGTVTLPDVIFPGPGATDFTAVLRDGTWSITDATPVTLSILVSGPNTSGPLSYTMSGTVR